MKMNTPHTQAARLEQAYRRLGTRSPSCVICGESYAHALELHHIGEQAFHDDLAIVCRNCHRKLSDGQIDRRKLSSPDRRSETIGRYLLGLSDLFRLIANTLSSMARELLSDPESREAEE